MTILSAVAAWSARENDRIQRKDLGDPNAVPDGKKDYVRLWTKILVDVGARMRPTAGKI